MRSVSPARSAAIQGIQGLGSETRRSLTVLPRALIARLESEFERHDPRRTGTMDLELFRDALSRVRLPITGEAQGADHEMHYCYA